MLLYNYFLISSNHARENNNNNPFLAVFLFFFSHNLSNKTDRESIEMFKLILLIISNIKLKVCTIQLHMPKDHLICENQVKLD